MSCEIGRSNGSNGELPTDVGLKTKKYTQQRYYGSQQPQQSPKEEIIRNQGNNLREVSDVSVSANKFVEYCTIQEKHLSTDFKILTVFKS